MLEGIANIRRAMRLIEELIGIQAALLGDEYDPVG